MKRELKRTKRTPIDPTNFRIIELPDDSCGGDDTIDGAGEGKEIGDADGDREIGRSGHCVRDTASHDPFSGTPIEFAGQVIVQHRLDAMRQALSEHTQDGQAKPGRHSIHVDAAVSQETNTTGIGVVHKADRWYFASPWVTYGYRIQQCLDQTEAETWAVWQGLELMLERVQNDRMCVKPQDPCNVVVVYSDCIAALHNINRGTSSGSKVVRRIIRQSRKLRNFGIDVQLCWVPGHRGVPGNELADLVSKKAGEPVICQRKPRNITTSSIISPEIS